MNPKKARRAVDTAIRLRIEFIKSKSAAMPVDVKHKEKMYNAFFKRHENINQ